MPEKARPRLLNHLRQHAITYSLAALFTAIFFYLQVQKHNAFHSRIGDFARFSQAIWSVLDGKLLYTSMPGRSILGDHFSPIMALAAPLLLIWPDERVLFLLQAVNIAITGVILTLIMYEKRPKTAPFFAFAFFLNANVHIFTLVDFRRIIFGLPWMALAMLGLTRKNRKLLLLGLVVALLSKESVSLYIAAIGLYLVVIERDWKWGIGLTLFGGAMLVFLSDTAIPWFAGLGNAEGGGTGLYPQLFYYQYLGDSYGEIVITLLKDPLRLFEILFDPTRRVAIFSVMLPLGFLLLLAPEFAIIYGPFALLMLLSDRPSVHSLGEHYTASMMPVLFTAVAVGWDRLPQRWNRAIGGWLVLTTLLGFFLYSSAPFGGTHQPFMFEVDAHDRAGNLLTKRVPEQISLYTQTDYTPHLGHVDELDLWLMHHDDLPFSAERLTPVDFILIDRTLSQEPLGLLETELVAQNLLADPDIKIIEENDGIFFLEKTLSDHPDLAISANFEEKMQLARVEVAITDADRFYVPVSAENLTIAPQQTIRVSLFWEALSDDIAERTISVRLSAADGFLLAQQDHTPAEGIRPTSWWQAGDRVRDIHYLTVPAGTSAQIGTIDLVVYDSLNGEILQSAETNTDVLTLTPIDIQP